MPIGKIFLTLSVLIFWKIAVGGQWWATLKQGYERLLQWLALTAPRLELIEARAPPPEAETIEI